MAAAPCINVINSDTGELADKWSEDRGVDPDYHLEVVAVVAGAALLAGESVCLAVVGQEEERVLAIRFDLRQPSLELDDVPPGLGNT